MNKRLTRAKALTQTGRLAEATELVARVCKKEPGNAEAWFMHGTLLGNAGHFGEAADCLRQAITLQPGNALGHFNLGNSLAALGQFEKAAAAYSRAQKLAPGRAEIAQALARMEIKCGRFREAEQQYTQYLTSNPGDADALGNLGSCYFHLGDLQAAVDCYQKALKIKQEPGWLDGLGAALCQQGRVMEALHTQREAARLKPADPRIRSNLLLTLNYQTDISAADFLREHRNWQTSLTINTAKVGSYNNKPEPERPLKIGYVSPDFRTHSVAYFIEPLFGHHDRRMFELYAYACAPHRDTTTDRLESMVKQWRDISMLNDRQAAAQINADHIDILVDLSGHTAGNRLPIFSLKPAPVQITYLGYPATTGLTTMDYRMTSTFADPEGQEQFYTESLIRLPETFLCYTPPKGSPEIGLPPFNNKGYITFGSFNNLAKINEDVINAWVNILQKSPNSRLLIKNPSLGDPDTAQRYLSQFESLGIEADRLDLRGLAPTITMHLNTYNDIDIALDTFPYNGTTTTCEALWMGVPVIAVAGQKHASRVSANLLSVLGLDDLIASDVPDYTNKALELSQNTEQLQSLRISMRERMNSSPLCNPPEFTHTVEAAYRKTWQTWCSEQATSLRIN
jgi:predicted O-linked N-acetylglucosamine transferase (SPINDLY family)